jgi:acyl-CoA dehydrogenase
VFEDGDEQQRYRDIREEAKAIAKLAEPLAPEADESGELHQGIYDLLRTSSICEIAVPSAYGGRFETVDPLAFAIVREVFMGASAHLDGLFAMQGIGSFPITVGGSKEQKEEWLPKVASGEALAGLALTEPSVGSDLKNVKTEIIASGDDLILRGQKSYISNAGVAAFYCVFGRENAGYSMVLVPAGIPGLTIETGPELFAPAIIGTLTFDDVVLPAGARIGEPNQGFDLGLSTLGTFRVSMGAAAIGLARACIEQATRHAKSREAFGRPLARLGPVAGLLADSWTEIEMARLLVYRAADRARTDPLGNVNYASMSKLGATEAAGRAVDRCLQVMGRFGLERDSPIGRYYRHARPMRIAEGASEVLRLGIARQLCEEVK